MELIIFDCDGVLIDSELIACSAEAETLTAAGFPITTEEIINRFVGVPYDVMYQVIEEEMGATLPPDIANRVYDVIFNKYRTELKSISGAAEVLKALKGPKCVASSSTPAKLALGLVETDLFDLLYPHIYSVSLVERGKPHPDIFEYAAKTFDVPPQECLVVEDSVAGVTAARSAGMKTIGFDGGAHCLPGHADRLIEAGADRVISNLRELL